MRSLFRLTPYKLFKGFAFSVSKIVPKKNYLPPENQRGFLFKLFHKAKLSPAYPILCELFQYLQTNVENGQFQLLESNPKYITNFMFVHLVLLSLRFKESPVGESELVYLISTYFYIPFAERVQKSIPVKDFGRHFIDIYSQKYYVFKQKLEQMQGNLDPDEPLSKRIDQIQRTLRIIVYENKIQMNDPELIKLSKYYQAHKMYLRSLQWKQISQQSIRWGFAKAPQQIQ